MYFKGNHGHWTKRIFSALGVLAAALLSSCGKKTPTLNLLVWEEYADPLFVRGFEEAHHCNVTASYKGSSDELVAKLRGGSAGTYDVISPSSDVATLVAGSGLVTPLDLSKFPPYTELSPQLLSLKLIKLNRLESGGLPRQTEVYGVPFIWGPNPLVYDTRAFSQPPDSWAIFWDPRYQGKISVWDDLSTVYMAAQILGYDRPDPSHLYNLDDEELEKVKNKPIQLKPNIRKIWSTGGELTNLFENHEVVPAMGWPLMTHQLRKLGFPMGETIPKENTTGWIDHLMITSASQQKDLAYQFLEFMVERKTQKLVSDVTGYIPANPKAAEFMTAEEKKNLHLEDLDQYQKRI